MVWYDHNSGGWGWLAMTAGMLLFWGLLAWAVVALVRSSPSTTSDPEQVLAGRFARGEVEEAEYHSRLDALRAGRTPTGRR